jgi:multidrug resistance efflux pump
MKSKFAPASSVSVTLVAFMVAVPPWASAQDVELPSCTVRADEEVRLPAEESGTIVYLRVKDGSKVSAGENLGNLDIRQAQHQVAATKAEWEAAQHRHESQVQIEFAQKSADVAEVKHRKMVEANLRAPSSVPDIDVRQAKLEWETTILQISKAREDTVIAGFDAASKKAQWDAAQLAIERRQIVAPFDGVIVQLQKHQSEWVNPGDTILHMIRTDPVRVEGLIDSNRYSPEDLANCSVTVRLPSPNRQSATLSGRIVFISPVFQTRTHYTIRAEVDNREENGHWLLRPGQEVPMTIHLGTNRTPSPGPSRGQNR